MAESLTESITQLPDKDGGIRNTRSGVANILTVLGGITGGGAKKSESPTNITQKEVFKFVVFIYP